MTDKEIDQGIRKTIRNSIIVLIGTFIFVVVCLYIDFISASEDRYYWFQRSGSVAVLLSAGVEFWLSKHNADINPAPSSYAAEEKWNKKYGSKFNGLSVIALMFLIGGTFIWGYGDIPFKNS